MSLRRVMVAPLAIYLRDHYAGATLGVELVRRCHSNNDGSRWAAPLAELVSELEADRDTLLALMGHLNVEPSAAKTSASWLLEKVRRLKPHGRPLAYTPLARVVELEALATGITGKLALWRALGEVSKHATRMADFDFDRLLERGQGQFEAVERLRLEAAELAFAPRGGEAALWGPGQNA